MNKRKKHFAMLRAEEKRRKPPTKAQKRNLMSTYLKNIGRYKHNQLKCKSYKEIQELFDNEIRRVNTFIPIDSEEVKSKKETEDMEVPRDILHDKDASSGIDREDYADIFGSWSKLRCDDKSLKMNMNSTKH
ncbi:hypothetical protein Tco_0934664 [Tanacetum coccineum]